MITEKDLLEAIEECEKEPITENKIDKLANFYIIYDHLFGGYPVSGYSYAEKEPVSIVETDGGTEFLQFIDGMDQKIVWPVIGELMETIKLLNPRIYDGVFRRLE